ncbi:MAG: phosphonate ABC transporter, partial [Cyanobacteria bacterium]|nr:phosphonate ABC transporter [Cyanobacteriota bacterium]
VLRQRWGMPARFGLSRRSVGRGGREVALGALLLLPLLVLVAVALGVNPLQLWQLQPLPPWTADWPAVAALPWPALIGSTLALTLLAAALAVGSAPLLLLLMAPWPWGRALMQAIWALGRLWPPPLTALLLLFVLQPGVLTAALALAFHNLGILGRLLLEAEEAAPLQAEEALAAAGAGPRLALLYGRFSALARSYLAYGAYRADVILRETVVVGLVGAAGLGSLLLEALSSFAIDQLIALVAVYVVLLLAA